MLTCGTETEKTKRYSSKTTAADSETIIPSAKANIFEARRNGSCSVHFHMGLNGEVQFQSYNTALLHSSGHVKPYSSVFLQQTIPQTFAPCGHTV